MLVCFIIVIVIYIYIFTCIHVHTVHSFYNKLPCWKDRVLFSVVRLFARVNLLEGVLEALGSVGLSSVLPSTRGKYFREVDGN